MYDLLLRGTPYHIALSLSVTGWTCSSLSRSDYFQTAVQVGRDLIPKPRHLMRMMP